MGRDLQRNEVVDTPKPVMHQAAAAADAVRACTSLSKKSAVARPRAGPEEEGSVTSKFNVDDATLQVWNCARLSWPWEVLELRSFLESRYGILAEATDHLFDGHRTLDFAMCRCCGNCAGGRTDDPTKRQTRYSGTDQSERILVGKY